MPSSLFWAGLRTPVPCSGPVSWPCQSADRRSPRNAGDLVLARSPDRASPL